jgi:DNA modification methylase
MRRHNQQMKLWISKALLAPELIDIQHKLFEKDASWLTVHFAGDKVIERNKRSSCQLTFLSGSLVACMLVGCCSKGERACHVRGCAYVSHKWSQGSSRLAMFIEFGHSTLFSTAKSVQRRHNTFCSVSHANNTCLSERINDISLFRPLN